MALKIVTPATSYAVSMEELKKHLSVDFDDDDELIEIYRKAATEEAENFTGRAFFDQVWDLYLDEFPEGDKAINLPKSPLIEVLGIYIDAAADPIDAAGYTVDDSGAPARIFLPSGGAWPTVDAEKNGIRIRFRAGYVDEEVSPVSGEVPYAIRAAVMMIAGSLYANRESVIVGQSASMMPWASEQLLRPYRVHTAIA